MDVLKGFSTSIALSTLGGGCGSRGRAAAPLTRGLAAQFRVLGLDRCACSEFSVVVKVPHLDAL